MANTTLTPDTAQLAVMWYDPAKALTVDWEGNTFATPTATRANARAVSSAGLVAMTYEKALTTPMIGLTTVTGVGYLPAGVTVVGFIVKSDDLDSGTPALVQSLYIGDTEAVTGITTGQGGTGNVYPCAPTAITAPTEVKLKTTTRAATRAAGTVYVTALYYAS